MTFLAHRGLARFVLSSSRPHADFTEVAQEHFGKMARLISALYFLSIFPILLIYGVGLTNTVESFMINQLGMDAPNRVMLSGLLVFAMIAVMLAGEKAMLRAFAVMVYPLAAILAALSCYLIPSGSGRSWVAWRAAASSIPSGWRCRSPCSPSATPPPSRALPTCSAGSTASRRKPRAA